MVFVSSAESSPQRKLTGRDRDGAQPVVCQGGQGGLPAHFTKSSSLGKPKSFGGTISSQKPV